MDPRRKDQLSFSLVPNDQRFNRQKAALGFLTCQHGRGVGSMSSLVGGRRNPAQIG